jgi:hypothetical protein
MATSSSQMARRAFGLSGAVILAVGLWGMFVGNGSTGAVAGGIRFFAWILYIASSLAWRGSQSDSSAPFGNSIITLDLSAPAIGDEGQDQGRK